MSTDVIPFSFEGAAVRGVAIDGEPWFVAKDVADVLGYANPQKAVRDHCKAARPVGVNDSFTLDPQTTIIPERDLYRLIMRSKLPAAERFEEWVVGEVMPAIRKNGRYGPATAAAPLDQGQVHVSVPLTEYSAVMCRLIDAQADVIAQMKERVTKTDREHCAETAKLLIQETTLSDEEIAERMKAMIGGYMPEWVTWQRRLLKRTKVACSTE